MKTNCRFCGKEMDETEATYINDNVCPDCFLIYEEGMNKGMDRILKNPEKFLDIDELYREAKYS